jgi:hypothetical protein
LAWQPQEWTKHALRDPNLEPDGKTALEQWSEPTLILCVLIVVFTRALPILS